MFLYQLGMTVLTLAALPLLALMLLLSEKRRASFFHRMGMVSFLDLPPCEPGKERIWVHALSVGEVRSAQPLMAALARRSDLEVVFTASTRTGLETARSLYGDGDKDPALGIGYFPYDLWWAVAGVKNRIRPHRICLVETDLWPFFLHRMAALGIPVTLVNARLSERSFKGYGRLGWFGRLFFSTLSRVLVQTPLDRDRFLALGLAPDRVVVTGNMKFDQPVPELDPKADDRLRANLGIQPGQKVFLAGSTHGGEEEILFSAWGPIKDAIPGAKLVLAPRDPARSPEILKLARRHGLTADLHSRRSESDGGGTDGCDLTLIDGFGILAHAYKFCDLAFIGGSLVEQGGHNPLEAALFAKPVLFGPHMADFKEPFDLLTRAGGARVVHGTGDLAQQVIGILSSAEGAKEMGQAALNVHLAHQGAVERTLEQMG